MFYCICPVFRTHPSGDVLFLVLLNQLLLKITHMFSVEVCRIRTTHQPGKLGKCDNLAIKTRCDSFVNQWTIKYAVKN